MKTHASHAALRDMRNIDDCMNKFFGEAAEETNAALAQRVKSIRRSMKITQQHLSDMSGVSFGSIKRFERSGHISLISLTRIAFALGCEQEIHSLFANLGLNRFEASLPPASMQRYENKSM